MTRVLVVSNLFPNAVEPNRGTFNAQQFTALAKHCELEIIAPTAWRTAADRKLTRRQRAEPFETAYGRIPVWRPRYYYTPGMLRWTYPRFFFAAIHRVAERHHRRQPFDAVFGTWLYPDGVAAAALARRWGVPLLLKTHGTDIAHHIAYGLRRRQMARALEQAARIFCPSEALVADVRTLSERELPVEVLHNGVNTTLFRPRPREEARRELNLPLHEKTILFVGNLKPVKGLSFLVRALAKLDPHAPWRQHIIGRGELREAIIDWTVENGISGRVRLVGEVSHEQIPTWMNAADVLVLPSVNEGCPNVLLEAQACGTPVVASRVGGIAEITSDAGALLVPAENAGALAHALDAALERRWDRDAIRASVEKFTWSHNAERLYAAITEAVKN